MCGGGGGGHSLTRDRNLSSRKWYMSYVWRSHYCKSEMLCKNEGEVAGTYLTTLMWKITNHGYSMLLARPLT